MVAVVDNGKAVALIGGWWMAVVPVVAAKARRMQT